MILARPRKVTEVGILVQHIPLIASSMTGYRLSCFLLLRSLYGSAIAAQESCGFVATMVNAVTLSHRRVRHASNI